MLSIKQWVEWNKDIRKHYTREEVEYIRLSRTVEQRVFVKLVNGRKDTHEIVNDEWTITETKEPKNKKGCDAQWFDS